MKNFLIFSDLHINSESLKECILILEEIGSIAKQYNCNTIFNLGDTFDSLHPTSADLDLFATFIRRLNKKMVIIAAQSHESETSINSIVNHYGILSDNIEIVKEYKDEDNLYLGHFGITECPTNYGTTISQKDLAKYRRVFLGHIHSFYQFKNVIGLGSCRFVSFSEWQDKKVVAIITDYKGVNEKLEFVELKFPIPMKQLELQEKTLENTQKIAQNAPLTPLSKRKRGRPRKCPQEAISSKVPSQETQTAYDFSSICHFLDNLDPNTKVKVIIKDFSSYKQFINVEDNYKQKFVKFLRVNDFSLVSEIENTDKQKTNLKESFDRFAKERNVNEEIIRIIKKELK